MSDNLLHEQLAGVTPPDPPTGDEPIEDEASEDPKPQDGAEGDDEGGEDPKEGRPAENYYRELIRKSEEREERMLQMMERIADSTAVRSEPVKKSGDSLDDRSIDELENLRDQVPDDRRAAYDTYLNKRRVQAEVDTRMSALEQKTQVQNARTAAGQEAVNRYPDLADSTSDFARKVNAKLKVLGRQYIDANPRAIVDAANEVAIAEGRGFRSQPGRRPKGSQVKRQNAPVDGEIRSKEGKSFQSKEETAAIAKRLSRALPKGKSFDIDKINTRANDYDQNRSLFIK